MSATQKELRTAYMRGLLVGEVGTGTSFGFTDDDIQKLAFKAYPPTTVVRPRVVQFGNSCELRVVNGMAQERRDDGAWKNCDPKSIMQVMLNLAANPTETVGDED